jgi:hypothetical protein
MKYIKTFNESLKNDKISKSEFIGILNNNCKKFLSVKDIDVTELIYRKDKDLGDYVLVDPKNSKVQRIAPFSSSNYHNLIISNIDSWKEWPRRNKSLICSGLDRAINHTGYVLYCVIPFDDTIISSGKKRDFWESFSLEINSKNIYDMLPEYFEYFINDLHSDNSDLEKPNDKDWDKVKYFFENAKVSNDIIKKYFTYKEELIWDNNLSLLDNLSNILSPERNEFTKGDILETLDIYSTKTIESWFEDKAILIKSDLIESLLEEIK